MSGEMLKGHLDMLLLSVVKHGPAHGYELIERLKERSGGRFELAEGTIYPALHRLEVAGFLVSRWAAARDGVRRRRVYELTKAGRAGVAERAQAWRDFVEGVETVLGERACVKTS